MNPTKDTPGGSFTRQASAGGLGQVIAWGLGAVAANNGFPVPEPILLAAGATIAGALGFLWRHLGFIAPAA